MRHCEYCGKQYDPLRVLRAHNGDYPLSRFCSGLCQANAGVVSVQDLLRAEREPRGLSVLSDEEREAIEQIARDEWLLHEGGR